MNRIERIEKQVFNGIRKTINKFREKPFNFFTEADIHSSLINDIKTAREVSKKTEFEGKLEKNNKELEALEMIMNKVNTYRTNTFVYLRDKEDIDKMISYIRIYKEKSD